MPGNTFLGRIIPLYRYDSFSCFSPRTSFFAICFRRLTVAFPYRDVRARAELRPKMAARAVSFLSPDDQTSCLFRPGHLYQREVPSRKGQNRGGEPAGNGWAGLPRPTVSSRKHSARRAAV